jgi:hypothetical protein
MLIENGISEAVQFFHIDALSSMVGMKVDFDMQLTLVARSLSEKCDATCLKAELSRSTNSWRDGGSSRCRSRFRLRSARRGDFERKSFAGATQQGCWAA